MLEAIIYFLGQVYNRPSSKSFCRHTGITQLRRFAFNIIVYRVSTLKRKIWFIKAHCEM